MFASLFMQRDLEQLAHLIATTSNISVIPKTVIFSQTKMKCIKIYFAQHVDNTQTFGQHVACITVGGNQVFHLIHIQITVF